MKKILSMILCACLLLCSAAAFAEAAETNGDDFTLKVWNRSGEEFSYLRFEFYDGDRQTGYVLSCPNEGEDFYRAPCSTEEPGEGGELLVKLSYGVSDLDQEDAILQAMMGKPAEEHPIMELTLTPESGKEYGLELVKDGDRWAVRPVGE